MSSVAEDPLAMTYFHIKKENDVMDWHEITKQAQDFTDAFKGQLEKPLYEDKDVRVYFWENIRKIVAEMPGVTLVTEETDPLLMLTRNSFTFVYCSLMRTGLHVGCWMAKPKDTSTHPKPKLLCCFLHEARIQKRGDWSMFTDIDKCVDCEDDFDLSM
jgi:hypothetical protein